jgi:methionine synthase II (cobalamin-independent)
MRLLLTGMSGAGKSAFLAELRQRGYAAYDADDWAEAQGMPAERMLTEGIDLINGMVAGISGVRLAIHLCRGNNAGMWMASGGYDCIAQALFERANAFDAFLLEYDDPRSGSFEPLAKAPDDKQIGLGLVTTKSPREETPAEIAARVDEAARSFPREQLGVSTQCGFASIAAGNPVSEEVEARKLGLVAEVPGSVWG